MTTAAPPHDPVTGEVLGPDDDEQLVTPPMTQLPLLEGIRMENAELTISGTVKFTLWADEDQELVKLLKLGKKAVLVLHIGDRQVQLDAQCQARQYALKGSGKIPTTSLKVKILDDGEGGL